MPYQRRGSWRSAPGASVGAAALGAGARTDRRRSRATIHSASSRPSATSGDQPPSTSGSSSAATTATRERPAQPRPSSGSAALLPARERPDAHQEHDRRHQRRRTPRRSTAGRPRSCPGRARRGTADTACRAAPRAQRDDEQHVVGEQQRLARHRRRSAPPRPTRGARHANSSERAADHEREEHQDEHAARADRSRTRAPTSARPSARGTCRAATARRRRSRAARSSS